MQFTPFLTLLVEIEDPRRAEGKLYRLPHVVLFAILAMVARANSYRSIHSFIDVHFVRLRKFFKLKTSDASLKMPGDAEDPTRSPGQVFARGSEDVVRS